MVDAPASFAGCLGDSHLDKLYSKLRRFVAIFSAEIFQLHIYSIN